MIDADKINIDDINPCHAGHAYERVGRTNLMRCRRCDKVIYREFDRMMEAQ